MIFPLSCYVKRGTSREFGLTIFMRPIVSGANAYKFSEIVFLGGIFMKLKYIIAIMLILASIVLGLAVNPAVAQTCTVHPDWPTYRVVRGDTLAGIAARYGLSTSALAAANCIVNVNLIYVGQVLHVPTGSYVPPSPGYPQPLPGQSRIFVDFQQFQTGFMIWRSDNSDIWVYTGSSSGSATRYVSRLYSLLPDNPFTGATPSGLIRPILGFGRIWGSSTSVRAALGWATSAEIGYSMLYEPVSAGTFYFSLLGGRTAETRSSSSWSLAAIPHPPVNPPPISPPSPPPSGGTTTSVTVSAAYQLFENGFMLWRADTNRIDLFTKTYVAGYNFSQYASLPDDPVTDQPPPGRVKPINGFGRVWGNFVSTRNALGWALGFEQGYQATFRYNPATYVTCVNLPDGHFVSYPHFIGNRSWMWQYETSCG